MSPKFGSRGVGTKRLIRRLKSLLPHHVPNTPSSAVSKRHRQPLGKLAPVLTIALICLSLTYWVLFHLLTIRHITCTQNNAPCGQPIIAELNHYLKTPIIASDFSSSLTKIQGFDKSILTIHHQYQPPTTINFTLETSPPLAQIASGTNSGILIVTQNHTLVQFSKAPLPELELLIASSSAGLEVGQTVTDHNLLSALNLVSLLNNYYLNAPTININQPDKTVISLPVGPAVYVSLFQDLEPQVKALSLILGRLPLDGQVISIDLRSTNPVITRPVSPQEASGSATSR